MSSADPCSGLLALGGSALAISYPPSLASWFDNVPASDAPPGVTRLAITKTTAADRLAVQVDSEPPLGNAFEAGDALATFWERAAYLLVDGLRDAAAVHGAFAVSDDVQLLIPGHSGAGKTHLALWSRLHGFEVLTDEVVALAPGDAEDGGPRIAGVLPRPLILKQVDSVAALLRENEAPAGELPSAYGRLVKLPRGAAAPVMASRRGLIVLPRFVAGTELKLALLSPGEAAARLLECCLNVRNLPRGGLPILSAAANHWPAVALDYGATAQLEGRLDLLLKLHGDHALTRADLSELCKALSHAAPVAPASPALATRTQPVETVQRFPRRLSIGMATYDDYDGVYFTIQSIRINNPQLRDAIEFIVVDNDPAGRCAEPLAELAKWIDGYRYIPRGDVRGTAVRDAVFREASSPLVLCVDSHVLIAPGALTALLGYFEARPFCRDLVQGPLVYDDLAKVSTHWEATWRGGMFGTWASDPRGEDPAAPPFEIPLQGLGVFACLADAWPGFNPLFRGFGGEEGYIHEKFRQRGGRVMCLPALRWVHRFGRPMGVPYVNRWEDRIRNYYIGFNELGLDSAPMEAHFAEMLGREPASRILDDIRREFAVG